MAHTTVLIPATASPRGDRLGAARARGGGRPGQVGGAARGRSARRRLGDAAAAGDVDAVARHGLALKGPCTTRFAAGSPRSTWPCARSCACTRGAPGAQPRGRDLALEGRGPESWCARIRGAVFGIENHDHRRRGHVAQGRTEVACRRIARFAFEYGLTPRPQEGHRAPQANYHELTDGLFCNAPARSTRAFGPDRVRGADHRAAAMRLVMDPPFRRAAVRELYGDVISELCAGLVGGLGGVPGQYRRGPPPRRLRGGARQRPRPSRARTSRTARSLMSSVMMLNHPARRATTHRRRSLDAGSATPTTPAERRREDPRPRRVAGHARVHRRG